MRNIAIFMFDLNPLVARVEETLERHKTAATGVYDRWAGADNPTYDGINPYGVADAANILYTIGQFPRDMAERAHWVAVLQNLQDPETGLYQERTHHPFHVTAHCIAALELFDSKPLHPLVGMAHLSEPAALVAFLDALDWRGHPWNASHQGAGLYAARVLAGEASPAWEAAYFDWLWNEADPATGMLRRGCLGPDVPGGIFGHLAGTFHYLFNQEYARRPLRYPAALVDFCLEFHRGQTLGRAVGFAEVDWVYCLTRAVRQSGHRFEDSRVALREFAARYIAYLNGLDTQTHPRWNDLHALFGALCCLAELQTALPGQFLTDKPLKLVLDRRPFI